MMKTVLVPLDQSTFAEEALVPAAAIARALHARLDLVLVHQQPKLANLRKSDWSQQQFEVEDRYLEHIARRLSMHDVEPCTYAVRSGVVEDAIIERAHSIDADLIVMTSHGATGFSRARLGSVAYALVHESELPVLMLHGSEGHSRVTHSNPLFRRILVPLDGSQAAQAVLPVAMELARCSGATVILLRIVEPVPLFCGNRTMSPADIATGPHPIAANIQDLDATRRQCAKAEAELAEVATLLLDEHVPCIESRVIVAASVSAAILDYAAAMQVDMIAMTTQGSGLSRWLLGSVTDAVQRTSRLPLLLARPARSGVRSPVGATPDRVLVPGPRATVVGA